MEYVRLIRFSNEGFHNYPQPHIRGFKTKIEGCYAFIEKEEMALISYKKDYLFENPELTNKKGQKRHELMINEDTLVFVKNNKIEQDKSFIFFNKERTEIIIPQEPIQKTGLVCEIEFPLSMDIYIKVPLSFAKKQIQTLLSHYEWIKTQVEDVNNICINTRVIDYVECIINTNDIKECN